MDHLDHYQNLITWSLAICTYIHTAAQSSLNQRCTHPSKKFHQIHSCLSNLVERKEDKQKDKQTNTDKQTDLKTQPLPWAEVISEQNFIIWHNSHRFSADATSQQDEKSRRLSVSTKLSPCPTAAGSQRTISTFSASLQPPACVLHSPTSFTSQQIQNITSMKGTMGPDGACLLT